MFRLKQLYFTLILLHSFSLCALSKEDDNLFADEVISKANLLITNGDYEGANILVQNALKEHKGNDKLEEYEKSILVMSSLHEGKEINIETIPKQKEEKSEEEKVKITFSKRAENYSQKRVLSSFTLISMMNNVNINNNTQNYWDYSFHSTFDLYPFSKRKQFGFSLNYWGTPYSLLKQESPFFLNSFSLNFIVKLFLLGNLGRGAIEFSLFIGGGAQSFGFKREGLKDNWFFFLPIELQIKDNPFYHLFNIPALYGLFITLDFGIHLNPRIEKDPNIKIFRAMISQAISKNFTIGFYYQFYDYNDSLSGKVLNVKEHGLGLSFLLEIRKEAN